MAKLQTNQLSNTGEDPQNRPQLILQHTDFSSVTDDILKGNDATSLLQALVFGGTTTQ